MAITDKRPMLAIFAVMMLVAATWLALPMPQEMPALADVQLCSHAVERHGDDALEARRRLFECKPRNLRWKFCPPGSKYGSSVAIWCQPPGATICPGMYVTLGGIEKTAFMRPCNEWGECQ